MDKVTLLQQRAVEFQRLLEKYAKEDDDVEDFLRRVMPWFDKIKSNQVTHPNYDYQLSIYFTNPDLSPLAERYFFSGDELGEMCAKFTSAIRGW